MHNLVLEMTRASIDVKNMKMRVESIASRLEFNERRARALEAVVQYRPDAERGREHDRDRRPGPGPGSRTTAATQRHAPAHESRTDPARVRSIRSPAATACGRAASAAGVAAEADPGLGTRVAGSAVQGMSQLSQGPGPEPSQPGAPTSETAWSQKSGNPEPDAREPESLNARESGVRRPVRLAVVVQRYGADINGGAELHARYVAEHLARHAEVEVFTTCARDYVTWANELPAGAATQGGVLVRRFPVSAPRDVFDFARRSTLVFTRAHSVQ